MGIAPFVILDRARNSAIGATRFVDIALDHRRLEIGATWITSKYQRTGANVEAKLLPTRSCIRDACGTESRLEDGDAERAVASSDSRARRSRRRNLPKGSSWPTMGACATWSIFRFSTLSGPLSARDYEHDSRP